MADFYIGSRNGWDTINKAVGGSVRKLNGKMTDTLASVAMKQGIKKTQLGKKLEFYGVNKEQLDRLVDPATAFMLKLGDGVDFRPLITVDGAKMTAGLNKVNSQYSGRMDYKTHQKYLADLFKAVEDSVFKINEDTKTQKKKYSNPGYAVGDHIGHLEGHNSWSHFPAVITKITDAGYQYRVYRPCFNVDTNNPKNWAEKHTVIKDATGWGDHWVGKVIVPFLANKHLFLLEPKTYTCRWTRRNQQVRKTTEDKETYVCSWDHCN